MELNRTVYNGRPMTREYRLPKEIACYDLLDELGMDYTRVDHEFADTIEACEEVEKVLGEKICKNLFLCNRQKTQFYLLMLEGEKVFKTKDLSKQLGVARLSFADAEDMEKYLNITPGSVSILGLMNDAENRVQLVMDKPIAESVRFGCHPCINSSTLTLSMQQVMERFLPRVHHEAIIVDLPLPETETE
ncbi:MAG: prolyl-tRNA synthetase associated domain-containing protein [Clostridia bacterium]|nr:prolyl-tRNA synthetase associated domain-containing protein [Clostridia bacterium]